jgi:ammonia channel protein AmtB
MRWLFAAAATVVLLKVLLDVTVGLRVTQQDEMQGRDLSELGDERLIFFLVRVWSNRATQTVKQDE